MSHNNPIDLEVTQDDLWDGDPEAPIAIQDAWVLFEESKRLRDLLSDSLFQADLGPALTCEEVVVFADWMRTVNTNADALFEAHAASDEPGDTHFRVKS